MDMAEPDHSARDQEIVRLWKQGWSRKDIAQRFRRSPERIRQITLGEPQKTWRTKRAVCLEGMVRLQDSLDMQWSSEIIVPVLGLKGWARKMLGDHFRRRRRKTISLRELMDLVLPYGFRDYFHDIPILRCAGLGCCTHKTVIGALTACDLGPLFHAEWSRRMDCYQRYWPKAIAHA